MSKTITIDYDDIVGAYTRMVKRKDAIGLSNDKISEIAKSFVQHLFDEIEEYQQSGLTLDEIESQKDEK